MCKGMGDLERRFGAIPTEEENASRIAGAVDVFLKAYEVLGTFQKKSSFHTWLYRIAVNFWGTKGIRADE